MKINKITLIIFRLILLTNKRNKKKKKRKRKKIKKKKEKYKMNNKNKEKYGLLLPSLVALLN